MHTWTLMPGDRHISGQEYKSFASTYTKRNNALGMASVLNTARSRFGFNEPVSVSRDFTPYADYVGVMYSGLLPIFTLQLLSEGSLSDYQFDSGRIKETKVQVFIAPHAKPKVTVSSYVVPSGETDLAKVRHWVLKFEEDMAKYLFNAIFSSIGQVSYGKPYKIAIYHVPQFGAFGPMPIQTREQIEQESLATKYYGEVLDRLRSQFPAEYEYYLGLISDKSGERKLQNGHLYPSFSPKISTLMATYPDSIYGITSESPQDSLSQLADSLIEQV